MTTLYSQSIITAATRLAYCDPVLAPFLAKYADVLEKLDAERPHPNDVDGLREWEERLKTADAELEVAVEAKFPPIFEASCAKLQAEETHHQSEQKKVSRTS